MKKRILSILLTLCMVLCLAPTAAFAAGERDLTGTGTAEDPFLVYTAEGLKALRDSINARYWDALRNDEGVNPRAAKEDHVRLMNDIVLNDGVFDQEGNYTPGPSGRAAELWLPISFFKGTFDGQGHTIRGLYTTPGMDKILINYGLISCLRQGTVQNLTVTGYIHNRRDAGSIVAYAELTDDATIKNCVSYCTVRSEERFAGGILGYASKYTHTLTISGCANYGAVTGGQRAGGILGCSDRGSDSDTDKTIIQGCLNAGRVESMLFAGGIAGMVTGTDISLTDCFNTGAVTGTDEFSRVGGILGYTGVYSNFNMTSCYSVGAVEALVGGAANGLVGQLNGYNATLAAEHCFWLDGTAEAGFSNTSVQPTDVAAKTRAEFADGTVLALLKAGRTDSPWADECKYLAAAGMTLPLFQGQGDSHDHDYAWQSTEDQHWQVCACGAMTDKAPHSGSDDGDCTTAVVCACGYVLQDALSAHNYPDAWTAVRPGATHTRSCQNPGCQVMESRSCTGGAATCTDRAACEVCGAAYGEKAPANHTGTQEWTATEAYHEKSWTCCGAEVVASEPHQWENSVCTLCGYGCQHQYQWQTDSGAYWKKCGLCGRETARQAIPGITITGPDTVCRTQDYTFTFTLPQEIADAVYGYEFTYLGDGPLTPTCENGVYTGVVRAAAYPEEETGFKVVVYAETVDGFTVTAEKTVTIQNSHTGGRADCCHPAVCEICREPYGPLDPTRHVGGALLVNVKEAACTQDGYTGDEVCKTCGETVKQGETIPAAAHDYKDGKCTVCGAADPNYKPAVKTGDDSAVTLWAVLLPLTALLAALAAGRKKRLS